MSFHLPHLTFWFDHRGASYVRVGCPGPKKSKEGASNGPNNLMDTGLEVLRDLIQLVSIRPG